jgi:hypothetical protein
MYDHTAERVAYLMHEERLAQLPRKRLVAEAAAAKKGRAPQGVGTRYRLAVARLLIALAARITPAAPGLPSEAG